MIHDMYLCELKWITVIYFALFFITVVDGRSISIEISHDETFVSEEIDEQEVIPTVEVLAGDRLHVIKIGEDPIKDFHIPPEVFSNLSLSLENKAVEAENETDDTNDFIEEAPDKQPSYPKSEVIQNRNRSRLMSVMTGSYQATTAPDPTTSPKMNIIKTFIANRRRRHKRQVGLDMSNIANEGWANKQTTPAANSSSSSGGDGFQVITESDRDNARNAQLKTILIFTGSTLLTVLMFSGIMFCFLRDPKACIVAFGTGCPCLLVVFPCVMKCLDRYLNPARMVKENLNRYLPGVIIHEDGTLEKYNTTPEEIECMKEIISEVMEM
ncbi:uncharacterized protein LOC117315409 [Pecten maximus]|uniref:uncharacterized protein LOC117315409 n=1 Tax=Pecten maximus TaxID=6579 RepID=UPI00145887B4|nr:uncharacterized protein LOC117315409 [Pecten maximus]